MEFDDPDKPEFASWDSYFGFAWGVKMGRRYVLSQKDRRFLETVQATIGDRAIELENGKEFFRAQRGNGMGFRGTTCEGEEVEEPVAYSAERMKPRPNQAMQGRANPAGIPVLYLGSSIKTVIAEVRPWVGGYVSVARFRLKRPLRAIDLSKEGRSAGYARFKLPISCFGTPLSPEHKAKVVWADIENAFSTPVTVADDTADYAPTQILAEFFRDLGYDALIYTSQFGSESASSQGEDSASNNNDYNIVLFNMDDADVEGACGLCEVTGVEFKYKVRS